MIPDPHPAEPMPFISYARNAEDVLLWRALGDGPPGFYVDLGATHPDADSVTRAFYDRSWHGLNLTGPEHAPRLAAARPRDTTLTAGRLATILHAHAPEDIHFLRIGPQPPGQREGQGTLAGLDLRIHRPRIVLADLAALEDDGAALRQAGYRLAFFDGLNRFYLAEEWAALAPRLATPANANDRFVRVSDAAWARQATAHQAAIDHARAAAAATEASARAAYARAFAQARDTGTTRHRLAQLERDHAEAAAAHHAAEARLHAATAHATEAAAANHTLRHELAEARHLLAATRASTSWRLTAPLRAAMSLLRRPTPTAPEPAPAPAAPQAPELPAAQAAPPDPAPAPPHPRAPGTTPLRAVHQFHSGSATGDAVTNSMLLIRTRLRAMGYRSDIFVEHRDPALADTLHRLDDLPAHAGFVLLLHHSMGHAALDRILAHPAPKVLYYHNITPTHLLPDEPSLQHFAAHGRQQLADIRGCVHAALAASEYNAVELRRAGFAAVRACPLLFDVDDLRRRAARPALRQPALPRPALPQPGQPYTVLFVGRLIESKAQADLVDAFARFRTELHAATGQPARLVLVGRTDSPGTYLDTIGARLEAHAIAPDVVITGPVSDDVLHAHYAAADLYVSLSHHEGFGVPLAEAAAYRIPVLAAPVGAVPYTLGGRLGVLEARDPAHVAARMLAVAQQPGLRAALLAEQQAALDGFALPHHLPALHQALALAGAAPPVDPAARLALAPHLAFAITGHVRGSYSLAAVNRGLAAAIEAERPGQVRLVPVEGAPITDLSGLDDATIGLARRPPPLTAPEIVISQHYPIHLPGHRGDLTLAFVFWEESLLPPAMIQTLTQHFDAVLAPTGFVAKALRDSGLATPIAVIGQAPDLRPFEALAREREGRTPPDRFTFLHVSSCFPRKGVDALLAAYARAFRAGDPVHLVIKGFPNPHNTVAADLAALRAEDPGLPPVELIDHELDPAGMLALYRRADAMVLPTRGEGLNLPAAEAMAAGIPLIVTGLGGHMDFCGPETARLVGYRLAPSASHLATPHSLWAEPDLDDLVAALREATRTDPASTAHQAIRTRRARTAVARHLDREPMVRRLEAAALDLLLRPPPRPVRIAWITSWGVRCGIAEYTRHLLDAMPPHPAVAGHVVLSDDRTPPDLAGASRRTWQLSHAVDLHRLAGAITAEDPAIVVIQHQPGLLDWPGLVAWLGTPALQERVVAVTLHNTRTLDTLPDATRAQLRTALAATARIMVHTPADLDRLKRLGLTANVALMPHGVRAPLPARRPAARDTALIGCYGFFLPEKGVAELIAALAILHRHRPGTRLRLVNAEYALDTSAAEIARCRTLATELGVAGHIEWHTSFLPDDESLSLLAGCDLVVLPTQASLESSSASVRTALAAGRPVIVTPLPLFDDAGAAVLRTPGLTPQDIAATLEALLADPTARQRAEHQARIWLEANAWPEVAARFQAMLVGLHALTIS